MATENLKIFLKGLDPRTRSADFQRGVLNAGSNLTAYLVYPVLWFLSTPVFVARMGIQHFGIWMLVNSVLGFGGIMEFGLTDATVKYVSLYRARGDSEGVRRTMATTLAMYCMLGLLGAVIIVFLAPFLCGRVFRLEPADVPLATTAIQIGSLGLLARFFDSVFESAFYGYERYDLAARVTIITQAATILVNIVLVLAGYGLRAVVAATVIILFLGGIAKFLTARAVLISGLSPVPRADWHSLREITGFGVYRWLESLLNIVNSNVDRFLIASYIGPSAVAYYTVALQLARQVHAVLARASAFLFPFSASLFEQKDYARLRRLYVKSTLLIIVISVGFILPLFLCGRQFLTLWMGPEFALQAAVVLQIVCIRYALAPMGIINHNFLLGAGLVKVQTIMAYLNIPVIISGMFILIPRMGIVGAALCWLLTIPFMLFIRVYVDRKLFNVSSILGQFTYFLPVTVPFFVAYVFQLFFELALTSWFTLAPAAVLISAAGVAVAWAVSAACQRFKLIPQ
ncbi:MAG: oligosaccharide flippase family protein [Kiritimatiellia bacterium]